MVTNLFSIFDPSSSTVFIPNWVGMMSCFMFLPLSYWLISSRLSCGMKMLVFWFSKELEELLKKDPFELIFISLFVFILLNNWAGLIPYVFTCSSHLVYSLSLALPLWLSYTLYQWVKQTSLSAAHLLPESTPVFLMPFMVLVESISSLIRPLTLAVRLCANMIAGHLLLALLSGVLCWSGGLTQMSFMFILILLVTLEVAVAVIQAYVFVILSALYASELK